VFKWVSDAAQIVDNFAAVRGAHSVKTGFTLQLKRLSTVQWGQPNGAYGFTGQFSAPVPFSVTSRFNALADLLLGFPSRYSVQTTPFSPHLSYAQFASYVQDDWRLTRSLTANIGLRWEYFGRPVERDNQIASFDLATGQQVFPGQDGYPRSLVDSDYKDFRAQDRTGMAGTRSADTAHRLRHLLYSGHHQLVSPACVSGTVWERQQHYSAAR
jgi:outer membrane receptor protein involved in Fe transport